MRSRGGLLLAAAVLVATAACGADVEPSPFAGGPPSGATTGAPIDASVQSAAQEAGLEDCPPSLGTPAADALAAVELICLSTGEPVSLADFAGTPVVVNVWAHWCKPCRDELPLLAQAAEEYDGEVRFVGILYADENPRAAVELASELGVRYPQVADTTEGLLAPLSVRGLPQTTFLDAQGTILGTKYGPYRAYDEVTDAVDRYVEVSP